jgi:hypothetical protein
VLFRSYGPLSRTSRLLHAKLDDKVFRQEIKKKLLAPKLFLSEGRPDKDIFKQMKVGDVVKWVDTSEVYMGNGQQRTEKYDWYNIMKPDGPEDVDVEDCGDHERILLPIDLPENPYMYNDIFPNRVIGYTLTDNKRMKKLLRQSYKLRDEDFEPIIREEPLIPIEKRTPTKKKPKVLRWTEIPVLVGGEVYQVRYTGRSLPEDGYWTVRAYPSDEEMKILYIL